MLFVILLIKVSHLLIFRFIIIIIWNATFQLWLLLWGLEMCKGGRYRSSLGIQVVHFGVVGFVLASLPMDDSLGVSLMMTRSRAWSRHALLSLFWRAWWALLPWSVMSFTWGCGWCLRHTFRRSIALRRLCFWLLFFTSFVLFFAFHGLFTMRRLLAWALSLFLDHIKLLWRNLILLTLWFLT